MINRPVDRGVCRLTKEGLVAAEQLRRSHENLSSISSTSSAHISTSVAKSASSELALHQTDRKELSPSSHPLHHHHHTQPTSPSARETIGLALSQLSTEEMQRSPDRFLKQLILLRQQLTMQQENSSKIDPTPYCSTSTSSASSLKGSEGNDDVNRTCEQNNSKEQESPANRGEEFKNKWQITLLTDRLVLPA